MSEITGKLKEPFQQQLNQQLLQLDLANAEINEQENVIRQWPVRKKKIAAEILKPMKKWAAHLKKMTSPLDLRKYKREKKRLLRFKSIAWSSWPGFKLSFKTALLWTLNLVRILIILSFYIGVLVLIGFVFIKIINFLGGLF